MPGEMYRDSVDKTVQENSSVFSLSECSGCCQQGHAGSKTAPGKHPPVLNWTCQLKQADLHNGRTMGGWLFQENSTTTVSH